MTDYRATREQIKYMAVLSTQIAAKKPGRIGLSATYFKDLHMTKHEASELIDRMTKERQAL